MQGQRLLPVFPSSSQSLQPSEGGSVTARNIRTGSPSSEPHLSQKARA